MTVSQITHPVLTADEARALRAAHDTDARLLSRKPKHELAAILRSETGAQGIYSKDEMVSAILDRRGFGIARLNEAIHVLHHDVPWPDCPWCQAREPICVACLGDGGSCRRCGGTGIDPDPAAPRGLTPLAVTA